MAWIESHTVILRHRKLIVTAGALRLKPVYLLGHLHALWHVALEQQEDGDLSSWSDDLIANSAQYDGDSAKFVSLLLLHRWLDDAKTIHDWIDYAGLYLTRKYAGKYREKLVVIWAKHGRVYGGEVKKPPDKSNGSCNGSQTTIKQQLLPPQEGRLVSLISKDSSFSEIREFFNPGLHVDFHGQAVRLVALFLTCVKTSHRATKSATVNVLGQILIDSPGLEIAAIERGISAYAAECDAEDAPPSKRCSPLKFFEERRWESYAGGDAPVVTTKTNEQRARETAERVAKAIGD